MTSAAPLRHWARADAKKDGKPATYTVYCPCGASREATGYLVSGIRTPEIGDCPGLMIGGEVYAVDPRSVIVRAGRDGERLIVYEPSRERSRAPWLRDWLRDHPEWPYVVTETRR